MTPSESVLSGSPCTPSASPRPSAQSLSPFMVACQPCRSAVFCRSLSISLRTLNRRREGCARVSVMVPTLEACGSLLGNSAGTFHLPSDKRTCTRTHGPVLISSVPLLAGEEF